MRRAFVVVFALAAALAGCGSGSAPGGPSTASGPPVPADAALSDILHLGFADADHGYAVLSRCTAKPCETWIASTVDGGTSWTGVTIDGVSYAGTTPRVSIQPLDATHAMLVAYDHDQRWLTADNGHTWTQSAWRPNGPIDEIPTGAYAEIRTAADHSQQLVIEVTEVDGTLSLLAHVPGTFMTSLDTSVKRAADGSYWIQGDTDDASYLYVSRDRGGRWAEVPLPVADPPVRNMVGGIRLGHANGHTVYLVDSYRFRVWRTADDGAHWTALPVPWSRPTADIGLSATATADGRLDIVNAMDPATAYEVTATGDAFTPIPTEQAALPSFTGRYVTLRRAADGSTTYLTSVDGHEWTEVPFHTPAR